MDQPVELLPGPATADHRCLTRTSEKYLFVPTEQVVQELAQHGWMVSKTLTYKTRSEDRKGFQKHMVRLRRATGKQITIGDSIAELLMINSHDGTTSYQFRAGIFRLVCSNGMVVSETEFQGIRVPHKGNLREIIDASLAVAIKLPTLAEVVNTMKSKMLSTLQRTEFAHAASVIRYGEKTTVPLEQILNVRRPEDEKHDLWTTFNLVQENIMRGGGVGQLANGDFRTLRPVVGMDKNVQVNERLWDLAAGMVR